MYQKQDNVARRKSNDLALMASVGNLNELLEYGKESLIWIKA